MKAEVKFTEAVLGYPVAALRALGELACAEEEILGLSPQMAEYLRSLRLQYQNWCHEALRMYNSELKMYIEVPQPDIDLGSVAETLWKMALRGEFDQEEAPPETGGALNDSEG